MTRKIQTLIQAVHLATSGKSRDMARAALALDGLPVGGWGETAQAMRQIADYLPMRSCRSYTVGHFVEAIYAASGPDCGRYRARSTSEALARAAIIEAAKS